MRNKKKLNLTKDNIKILVCCHKKCELPPNPDGIFLPIQVGAAISNTDLGIQRDDQVNGQPCDNISEKNGSFCELTAMYWAWKNIEKLYPSLEYVGLNHYRRFFSFDESFTWGDAIVKPLDSITEYKINHVKLEKWLKKGYVIISKNTYYPFSLYADYAVNHISDDLKILQRVVHELSPEYDQAFYSALMRNNAFTPYNMTVIGRCQFKEYCSWLFRILFECEKRIDIAGYNPVQKRIWGYMAEDLFNVYLYKNCKKIKRLNIYRFDNAKPVKLSKLIFRKIRSFLLGKIFCIGKKKMPSSYILHNEEYMKIIGKLK